MGYDFYIWTERDGSDAVEVDRDKDEAIKMLAKCIDRSWLIQEAARLTDEPVWKKSEEELLLICEANIPLYDIITEYDEADNLDIGFGWVEELEEVKGKARGESHYDSWNDRWFERNWDRQTDSL